jgi:SAM-dependent methyltransferase
MKTYQNISTQFYELAKTAENADAEITFYEAYAAQASGPILEPMCGSGRILLPLLARGYAIEGFDASASMLAVLQKKHATQSQDLAPVWQQFLQNFGNGKKYALIIIPFGSFGLVLKADEALSALNTLRNHLAPGGKLIVEIDTVYSSHGPQDVVRSATLCRSDGATINVRALIKYDSQTQLFTSHSCYALRHAGVVITEEEYFEQYLYTADEFDVLVHTAGFMVVNKYANYMRQPAINEAPVVLYVLELEKII